MIDPCFTLSPEEVRENLRRELTLAEQKIQKLRTLCGILLEDLEFRITDRADSNLPEWTSEAKRLGVQILGK